MYFLKTFYYKNLEQKLKYTDNFFLYEGAPYYERIMHERCSVCNIWSLCLRKLMEYLLDVLH